MKALQIIYSLILLTFLSVNILGQDTTYLDQKINYFSANGDSTRFDESKRYKAFPKVEYAREIIKLEQDSFKVENCYYYDNKRFTNSRTTHYKILNDSTLITENQRWFYKKLNDSIIYVSNEDGEFIEKGKVIFLVPLVKHGEFLTLNKNNKLLIIEHYNYGKCTKIESPHKDIVDSIFTVVDVRPKFRTKYGDLGEYIAKRYMYPDIAIESSIQGKVFIRFVVTSNGEVVNSEILRGVDPFVDKEALKVVANLPDFEPGKINGENVNTF